MRFGLDPTIGAFDIAKSVVAVPAVRTALPFAWCWRHHKFMSCLVRLCDHLGWLLALLGIRPIKEPT